LRRKYEAKAATLPTNAAAWGTEGARQVRRVQNHAVYAAMIEAMDAAVGKILRALDDHGLRDRTLVIFTSDNGGLATSEGHPTSNLPLRAGKGWLYEGGIRVPWIARWPGTIPAGAASAAIVSSPDLFPTFLAAAGLPRARSARDGASLLPALRGQPFRRGPVFWHYPHYGNQGGSPGGAVRDGDWKLIEHYEDGSVELYNLAADLGETRNLATADPKRATSLRAQLAAWRRAVGAEMPTPRPAGDRP
jgi:arylsulfatase A-like enzyme